ncbi:MAG: DUF3592 domain-containing protein [Candidatus Hydrogenedentota bacterium]|nr:MAG: DUF3592 domain-containing protein [Candidatus Hydrogenedentota bacterium]
MKSRKRNSSNARRGSKAFFILFFSLFFLVGIAMCAFGLHRAYQAHLSQSWPSTNGIVTESKVVIHHSTGKNSSTTYGAEISYVYSVSGRRYRGSRVRVIDVSTSNPSYAQGIVNRYPKGKRVRVHYDPKNPAFAVLEPGFSLSLLFPLLLGVILLIATVIFLFLMIRRGGSAGQHVRGGDALSNLETTGAEFGIGGGEIRCSTGKDARFFWFFAVFWNLVASLPLLLRGIPDAWHNGDYGTVTLMSFFPLVGIIVLVVAIRLTVQARKFGISTFRFSPLPVPLGSRFRGEITVERGGTFLTSDVLLSWSCVHIYVTGTGKNRSTHYDLKWNLEQTVPQGEVRILGPAAVIPVDLPVPCDRPETDESNPANRIVWMLTASASIPGIDYEATFEVPVKSTDRTDPALTSDSIEQEVAASLQEVDLSALSPARFNETPDAMELFLPPFRILTASLVLIVVFLIFGGIAYGLASHEAPFFVLGIFGVILFFLGLFILHTLLSQTWLRIERTGTVLLKKSWLGIGFVWTFPTEVVEKVHTTIESSSLGAGGRATAYYGLAIILRDGTKFRTGLITHRQRLLHALAKRLRKAAGKE